MSDVTGLGQIFGSMINAGTQSQTAENQREMTQKYLDYLEGQQQNIQNTKAPQFDSSPLTPDKYSNPILAQGQQVSIDPQDRANQVAALNSLQGIAGGAAAAQQNAENYGAMQKAAQQQQAANGAIMQNLASRGALGSGQELAAKMQAGQNAANQSQAGMLQGAQNAALQRLQAQEHYLQGQGQLRGQDTDLASQNANIINQFNMANTAERNRINEANTQLGNQYGMYNRQMQNSNAQQEYQNALARAEAAAGEANTVAGGGIASANQQAANQAGILGGLTNGVMGGLGSIGRNHASDMFGDSNSDNGYNVEQTPEAKNIDEGSTFDGSDW